MARKRRFINETADSSDKFIFGAAEPFNFSFPGPVWTQEQPGTSSRPAKRACSSLSASQIPLFSPDSASTTPSTPKKRRSRLEKTQEIMDSLGEQDRYHLGDFLQHLFDRNTYSKLSKPAQHALSKWLDGNTRAGTRPAEIVDAIYRHPSAISRPHNVLSRANFSDLSPPTTLHASTSPEHISLLPPGATTLSPKRVNAREGLEELMVRGTLNLVEHEAQLLTDPVTGLTRSAGITWDEIEQFNRQDQEQKIRIAAPLIWTILATITLTHATLNSSNDPQVLQNARDTSPALIATIFMLVSFRHPRVNFFQAVMAVFLFACNAQKSVYHTLSRLGISTAYSTLQGHLNRLGKSATERACALARGTYESSLDPAADPYQHFFLVFDNVNKHYEARNQTVASKNRMKNGTAATAIVSEDVSPGAYDPKPYRENVNAQLRQALTVDQLLDDIDSEHLEAVGTGMVMRMLLSYVPSIPQHLRPQVEERFKSDQAYAKNRLRLRKSTTLSLGTSSIDESTVAGVSDILHDLVTTQMKMEPSWLDGLLIPACGDHLSIDRLRKAIRYKAMEQSIYESRSWALPFIQLWHMKLAYLRSILKVHWFSKVGSHLFGLRQSVQALGRSINPDKIDFYPCHNAVKTVFEGMTLTATYVFLQEHTSASASQSDYMLSELDRHFAAGGCFSDCSLAQLEWVANQVYKRYMTTEAYRSTMTPAELSTKMLILQALHHCEADVNYSVAESTRSGPESDQLLGNLILFMRDTFWYLELASAIPEGDTGRVFEILKMLRFSFWGSGAKNYGSEMLELASGFLYEFPSKLKEALLNNWLVNPSGLPGHWQECDFFQEHSNKAIKVVFNSKNSEWDSRFLRHAVSVNIGGLSRLRANMLQFLGLRSPGSGRARPDYSADINVLASHYLREQAFTLQLGRRQDVLAPDMFGNGIDKLDSGALKKFLSRTTVIRGGRSEAPVADTSEDTQDENVDIELNEGRLRPLVMEGGELVEGEFVDEPEGDE
ncbi:hypothetical protein FRC12_022648 [Ceratobasidium sp. 428]|nr:hypothetical protein FRC12_022648 [Ceratobasidium sp. 428]